MSVRVYSFLYLKGSFCPSLFSKYCGVFNPHPSTKVIFHSVHPSCKAISGQCFFLHTSFKTQDASNHFLPLFWRTWGPENLLQVGPVCLKFVLSHWCSTIQDYAETSHLEVTCGVFRLYPKKSTNVFLCSRITQICCNFILIPFLNSSLQVEKLNYVFLIQLVFEF